MVNVAKTASELRILATQHVVQMDNTYKIKEKLLKRTKHYDRNKRLLFNCLYENWNDILGAEPKELLPIIGEIEKKLSILVSKNERIKGVRWMSKAKKKLLSEIGEIFNYDAFSKKFAYEFCRNLDCSSCLYCNRQFIFTLENSKNEKKTRPQLDHFYAKSVFPYLAVSFYNLIPCCSICNTSLKGKDEFSFDQNFHPFVDKCSKNFRFEIKNPSVDGILANPKQPIEIELKPLGDRNALEFLKIERNATTFQIAELYSMHNDVIVNVLTKIRLFENEISKYESLTLDSGKLFTSKTDVINVLFSTVFSPQELGSRQFAKLINDLLAVHLSPELKCFLPLK